MISVLMATYNGEKFLREQLDSVLNQTVSDFKLYISDDGSKDGTVKILKEYAKKDKRIKLMCDHKPTGSSCRNFLYLLENVQSDLYFFCDQDDVWTEDHIECMVKEYDNIPGEDQHKPVLVHSDLTVVDEELNVISSSLFSYMNVPASTDNPHYYFVDNNVTGCVTMINDMLKQYVFLNSENLKNNIDSILMHDSLFASIAKEFGIIRTVEKSLEMYRQHSENVVGASDNNSKKEVFKKIFKFDMYRKSYERYKATLEKYERYAEWFADYYAYKLSAEEYKCLKQFSLIECASKLRRLKFIRKNNFFAKRFMYNQWIKIVI